MKPTLYALCLLLAGCGGGGTVSSTPDHQSQTLKSVEPATWSLATLSTSCEAMVPAACGLPLAVGSDGHYVQTLASGATAQGTLDAADFAKVKTAADAVANAIASKVSTCEAPLPTIPGSGVMVRFELPDGSSRDLVAVGMAAPGQCNPPGTQQLADALRAARTHTQPPA